MPNTVRGQRKQHCMSLSTVHVYLSALREICVEKLVLFISSGVHVYTCGKLNSTKNG